MSSTSFSIAFEVKIEPFFLTFGIRGSFFARTVIVFTITTWIFTLISTVITTSLHIAPATNNQRSTYCKR
ncbi:hypothetical protein Hanom_Chr16g01515141 [Helianthus anomalus]